MKKILSLILFISVCTNYTQAQRIRAVSYMNVIEREFNMVQENMWYYTNVASHQSSAIKLESKRKELLSQIELSIKAVSSMKPFENSTRFRDSAVAFLKLNYEVLKDDFVRVTQLQDISNKTYEQVAEYLKLQESIDDKLTEAGRRMDSEQVVFGTTYGIEFEEKRNRISVKQEIADKVYDYYNPIYLLFFKNYLDEVNFIQAQTKQDSAAMEQYAITLLGNSKAGLEQLQEVKAFNKDTSLKAACEQMLQFYIIEVEDKFKDIKLYYAQKLRFIAAKNKIDTMPKEQRTAADVNDYNQVVADYNLVTAKFNQINQYLNETRNRLITNWNLTAQAFKDRHIPK